jgi:hypothetical protein
MPPYHSAHALVEERNLPSLDAALSVQLVKIAGNALTLVIVTSKLNSTVILAGRSSMPKAYPKEYPNKAKELRRMGFTFKEIAGLLRVPISTAIFWAHDTEMSKDGRSPKWLKLSDLASYLTPGVPFKELPLPSGVIAWLQKQSGVQQPEKGVKARDSRKGLRRKPRTAGEQAS